LSGRHPKSTASCVTPDATSLRYHPLLLRKRTQVPPLAVPQLPVGSAGCRGRVLDPRALRAPALHTNNLAATFLQRACGRPSDEPAPHGRDEPTMAPSLARSGTPTILSTTPAGRPWPARHLVVPGVSALDRCTKTKNTGQNLRNTRGRHIERLVRPVQNEARRRNRAASRRTCGKQTIPSRHEKRQHRRQPSFEPLEHRSSSLTARAQATRPAAYTPSEKTPSLDASIHDMTKTQYTPHPLRYIYLRILPLCQLPVKAICTKKADIPFSPYCLTARPVTCPDSTRRLCDLSNGLCMPPRLPPREARRS